MIWTILVPGGFFEILLAKLSQIFWKEETQLTPVLKTLKVRKAFLSVGKTATDTFEAGDHLDEAIDDSNYDLFEIPESTLWHIWTGRLGLKRSKKAETVRWTNLPDYQLQYKV